MRWIEFVNETISVSRQELSRAVEGRTVWTSLIHRIDRQESEPIQWHLTHVFKKKQT